MPTRVKFLLAVVAGGMLLSPLAVLAAHQFSDVPNGHPFHKEIGVVADAGIARGFDDGTYRPSNNVTRQAMAAFLERAVGRAGYDAGNLNIGNDSGLPRRVVVGDVSINAGAAGAGTGGFVFVGGTIEASTTTPATCPCRVDVILTANGADIAQVAVTLAGLADETLSSRSTGSLQVVVPIAGDESKAYQLVAHLADENVGSVSVSGHLTALYVPLGPDGDDTLAYEHTCALFESEPNNTIGTADSLPAGGCVAGVLTAGDSDQYLLHVFDDSQTITLETRSVDGAGCSGDTTLTFSNFSNIPIATSDDEGVGRCSRIVQTVEAGSYRVLVAAFSPASSFEYRVTASSVAASSAETPTNVDVDDIAKD